MNQISVRIQRRINTDSRGSITTGRLVNNRPRSTEHFVVDDFAELIAAYGKEPKKLAIMFPSNDPLDWLFSRHSDSIKNKETGNMFTRRYCDGTTCHFNMDMKVCGRQYQADQEVACLCYDESLNLADDEKCKLYTAMKAYVVHPINGVIIHHMAYKFENHSIYSTGNILSEIEKVLAFTGGKIMGVMFVLSCRMVDKPGKQLKKYPLWNIEPIGSIDQIRARAEQAFLPINPESAALMLGSGGASEIKMLLAGDSTNGNGRALSEPSKDAPPIAQSVQIDHPDGNATVVFNASPDALNHEEKARLNAEATLDEYRKEFYANDKKAFASKMNLFLHANWSGKFADVPLDKLQYCIKRFADLHKQ